MIPPAREEGNEDAVVPGWTEPSFADPSATQEISARNKSLILLWSICNQVLGEVIPMDTML